MEAKFTKINTPILKTLSRVLGLCALIALSPAAKSQDFNGQFTATPREIAQHRNSIEKMGEIVKDCLEQDYYLHLRFYKRHGISAFYGSNSAFSKKSTEERRNYLSSLGKDPNLVDQLRKTSCIGLTEKCYAKAMSETGQAAVWKRIMAFTANNNWDGSAIIEGLRGLGWYVMYWNPDTSKDEALDAQDKAKNPNNTGGTWGYHHYRYITATRQKKYYKNTIDDSETLVNFGTYPDYVVEQSPMLLGVAHSGYHVFPGVYGVVIEGHSTRDIRDAHTIETSKFNPDANGGAPRGSYHSGIIALPPGYEPGARRRGGWGW